MKNEEDDQKMPNEELFDNPNITTTTPKEELIKLAERCQKCNSCCTKAAGFILKEELPRIAGFLNIDEEKLKAKYLKEVKIYNKTMFKPKQSEKHIGECIFHEDNCTIHDVKPLHCKVSGCHEEGRQAGVWFMLNHMIDRDDPEAIRQYAIYLKSHPTIPGGKLKELVPNKERLKKILNYEIM